MTKRGGESYRHRFSILTVSAVVFAVTFLLPLAAYADDQAQPESEPTTASDTPELPSFAATDAYRVRAAQVSLRTELTVQDGDVVFVAANGQRIAGLREAPGADATYAVWHPAENPAGSGVMTAEIAEQPTSTQITLHDPALVLRAEQSGDVLQVHGSVGTALAGTSVTYSFNGGAPQAALCGGNCASDSLIAQIPLADVPAGEHTVSLQLSDASGEIAQTSASAVVTWPAKPDVDNTIIPVETADIYVPKLEVVPVSLLSTQFSVPVSSTRAAAISRNDVEHSASAPLEQSVKGAAITQTNPLKLSTKSADDTLDVPITPTAGGWSVFGLAWYWWVSGVAVTWAGALVGRWWLR